ncbi:MAG: septal ring lytic transglycosylase RlpA family protein [Pseudomonadota bacterium]
MRFVLYPTALVTAFALGGCSFVAERDGAPASAGSVAVAMPGTPSPEPRSRYGNLEFYEVAGERYYVMKTSNGYTERGVASWYGSKFHGKRTSSGEPYDMYAVSAAHKSLPLPTWVRVTHLGNGRSLVLRVNDRGPFVDNRIIDLSYAAARELDMIGTGTALVEVTALSFEKADSAGQMVDTREVQGGGTPAPTSPPPTASAPAATEPLFLQTGAFSEATNANRQRERLIAAGIAPTFVEPGSSSDNTVTLYRVRIGPIDNVAEYDALQTQLQALGIDSARLVSVE